MLRPILLALVLYAAGVQAHHGWSEYDNSQVLSMTGTIKESGYEHPHGHVRLEVPGKTWLVVLAPPSRMENRGLAPEALKAGNTVTVVGYANREKAEEMRAELGVAESGLARLIHAAFQLLELIVFFTADEDKEAMARSVRKGSTAWEAAGKIHTEIQRAFVRAEVVGWNDLVEAGGYVAARDRGLLRTEGRTYEVADGDVLTVKV